MKRYLPTLPAVLQDRDIRLLFVGQTVSFFGTWIGLIALNVKIYALTQSSLGVAAILLLTALPSVLAGIIGGVYVDRYDRRRLLILTDTLRVVFTLAILFTENIFLLYGLVFANALAGTVYRMARMAIIPQMSSRKETLISINALLNLAQSLTLTLGPAVGGLLVAMLGVSAAFALDALTFAVSAFLIWRMSLPLEPTHLAPGKTWQQIQQGFAFIKANRPVYVLILSVCSMMLGTSAINALEIVYAQTILHTTDSGYGLLVSAWGVGVLLGTLAVSRLVQRIEPERLFMASMALLGSTFVLYAYAPTLSVAILIGIVGGWGNGILVNLIQTLLQNLTPSALMGRVGGFFTTARDTTVVIGLLLSGVLSDVLGIQTVFVLSGIVVVVTAGLSFLSNGMKSQPTESVAVD